MKPGGNVLTSQSQMRPLDARTEIAAGDNARIEDGTHASVFRFRVRSTVAGSPSTAEVQYRGISGPPGR